MLISIQLTYFHTSYNLHAWLYVTTFNTPKICKKHSPTNGANTIYSTQWSTMRNQSHIIRIHRTIVATAMISLYFCHKWHDFLWLIALRDFVAWKNKQIFIRIDYLIQFPYFYGFLLYGKKKKKKTSFTENGIYLDV